jgi:phage baseplate assembly protein W
VHFGRRVRRLLLTAQNPALRERLEAEAVAMLGGKG